MTESLVMSMLAQPWRLGWWTVVSERIYAAEMTLIYAAPDNREAAETLILLGAIAHIRSREAA